MDRIYAVTVDYGTKRVEAHPAKARSIFASKPRAEAFMLKVLYDWEDKQAWHILNGTDPAQEPKPDVKLEVITIADA